MQVVNLIFLELCSYKIRFVSIIKYFSTTVYYYLYLDSYLKNKQLFYLIS